MTASLAGCEPERPKDFYASCTAPLMDLDHRTPRLPCQQAAKIGPLPRSRWKGQGEDLVSKPSSSFARWAMCALLRWRPSPAARKIRVFQIHGNADATLPVRLTRPDVIVPSGGHALSLFHSSTVNQEVLDRGFFLRLDWELLGPFGLEEAERSSALLSRQLDQSSGVQAI